MDTPAADDFDQTLLQSSKLKASTVEELFELEKEFTTLALHDVIRNPVKGKFDFDHLKEIHRRIFDSVYTTAGKDRFETGLRTMFVKHNISNTGETMFVHGNNIPEVANAIFGELKSKKYFKGLSKQNFIEESARFFGRLNMLHPFREGNGRTQRIFMVQLAMNAGYSLRLDRIDDFMMITACQEASKGYYTRLEKLFDKQIEIVPMQPIKEFKPLKEVVQELMNSVKKGFGLKQ